MLNLLFSKIKLNDFKFIYLHNVYENRVLCGMSLLEVVCVTADDRQVSPV